MEISQAKQIIEALSNGIDPTTGEILPKNHLFNDPDIIRALYVATEQLTKAEKNMNRKLPENAGKPWNEALDNELKSMYLAETDKKEICRHFGRTAGSISARLVRLGLIQSSDEFRYFSESSFSTRRTIASKPPWLPT